MLFRSSLIVFLLTAPVLAAASLENYAARITQTRQIIDRLNKEEPTADEVVDGMLAVKRLLVQKEDIEFNGRYIQVDNQWLHDAVDNVIKNANGDVEQRRALMVEISDRLNNLRQRIPASGSPSQTTAGERERLDRILARPEYKPEAEQESIIQKWLSRLRDAILRLLSRLGPSPEREGGRAGTGALSGLRILMLLLLLGALVFGALQLLKRARRRRRLEEKGEVREVLGEELADDVTASDLLARATELARQGEYRTAIRRAYLALLIELEQRGKLSLQRSKTNRDYLEALRPEREIYPGFAHLTLAFEEVWYGEMRATEDQFNGFLSRYRETVK